MGMPVSIHLRGVGVRSVQAERAVAGAYEELRRIDDLFSTYRPDSQLMRVRRGELDAWRADPLLAQVERLGADAERRTGGAFTTMLPNPDGGLAFDPTGLVKGWAVDRVSSHLAALPETSWALNAGGDVLVGRHVHLPPTGEDAAPWRVGVENPHDRTQVIAVVPLLSGAVATSGTAARGAHLYDPVTGRKVGRAGSSTVVGTSLLWADVWATALFVGGQSAREAFRRSAPGCQTLAA